MAPAARPAFIIAYEARAHLWGKCDSAAAQATLLTDLARIGQGAHIRLARARGEDAMVR